MELAKPRAPHTTGQKAQRTNDNPRSKPRERARQGWRLHRTGGQRSQESRVLSRPSDGRPPCLSRGKVPIPENSNLTIHRKGKKTSAFPLPLRAFPFGKDFINILRKSPLSLFPQVRASSCFRNGTSHTHSHTHTCEIQCHRNQNGNVLYINKHRNEFAQPEPTVHPA